MLWVLDEDHVLIVLQVWLDPNEVNEISMANSSEYAFHSNEEVAWVE